MVKYSLWTKFDFDDTHGSSFLCDIKVLVVLN